VTPNKEERTRDEKIFDSLNSMPLIRNKKVRADYARIYNEIYPLLSLGDDQP